jgi:hypothetical protein
MKFKLFVVAAIAAIIAVVVPAWGASSTQNLQGGDTLSVICAGSQLDHTVVNPTRHDMACMPSTTAATTTTSTTTTLPTTTTTAPGGTFSDGFADLSNWSFAHFAYEIPVRIDPRSTATVVGGQARIEAFDQNYGDAALRSAVKYNLTGGGTVTLDMTDDGAGNPLVGFANVSFTANPDDAKSSMADERVEAYSPADLPTDALQIQLRDNCRVPWGPPVVVRYLTSAPGGRTTQRGNCAATPDGHWRFVFTTNHVSIRNGANAEVVAYDVTMPPVGWFVLGVHNHASMKYSTPVDSDPSVVGLFDNVTYPSAAGGTTTTTTTTVPTTTSTTTTTVPTTTTGGTTTTTVPSGSSFSESFATDQHARFDWQLRTHGQSVVAPSFIGEHDDACHDPTTHRQVSSTVSSGANVDISGTRLLWWCAPTGDPLSGHMMTALDTTGIASESFSPKQTFASPTTVCWDQNMNDLGGGKWVNVYVVPAPDVAAHGGIGYDAGTALPFLGAESEAGLQRVPASGYQLTWLRGTLLGGADGHEIAWKSYSPGGYISDPAPRFQICIENSGAVIRIHRPDGTIDVYGDGNTANGDANGAGDVLPERFPTGDVRVIFQDASYNPTKHDGFVDHLTWHWDNILVA